LLTLLIVAVVIVQLARQQEVELLWTETLMIALAHYFTSRRFIRLPPDVVKQLTDAGELEQEWHPLYLPRNSIRTILILSFAGLGAYLFLQGKLLQSQALPILGVVFAYAFGIVARMRSTRRFQGPSGDCRASLHGRSLSGRTRQLGARQAPRSYAGICAVLFWIAVSG
jgi:hypothetical protein